jgi:putative photosynthetic complex assembly protein 2
MFEILAPVLFVLLAWWASTGVILYLDGLPRRTYPYSMAAMTAVLVAAFYGLAASADDTSSAGAYLAFACALAVWGWQEMGFLMGFVTGSRRTPCPPQARGFVRLGYATQTILHHEVALAVSGLGIAAATWGSANQTGTWTFLILWTMRLSTKFNLFLGVPNLSAEFLPPHLGYLASYFAKKPMNLLFPFSVTLATGAAGFAWGAVSARATGDGATSAVLLATILSLGVLEHWFLVVPLPVNNLWEWGLRSRETRGSEADGSGPLLGLVPAGSDLRPQAASADAGRCRVRPIEALAVSGGDVSMKRRSP